MAENLIIMELDYLIVEKVIIKYFINFFPAEYERIIRMTTIDFISSMGGIFGLCLGFSFVSFFELCYWVAIRLTGNMKI